MRKYGIWIDKREAKIISLEKERIETVLSQMEDFKPHGGSGTKLKGGPQDVVQDSKFLEREKLQFKAYFKSIASHLQEAEAIVIFGPAQSGEKLKKELEEKYQDIHRNVLAVDKADNMTDNQLKAWVRDFFQKHA